MQIEKWLKSDLRKLVEVNHSAGNLFYQDSGANLIGVEVTENGSEVTLSGSVTGSIITESGETLTVHGNKQGNKAWIVLPSDAYAEQGQISIFIKLNDGNVVTTIVALEGKVYKGR